MKYIVHREVNVQNVQRNNAKGIIDKLKHRISSIRPKFMNWRNEVRYNVKHVQ